MKQEEFCSSQSNDSSPGGPGTLGCRRFPTSLFALKRNNLWDKERNVESTLKLEEDSDLPEISANEQIPGVVKFISGTLLLMGEVF